MSRPSSFASALLLVAACTPAPPLAKPPGGERPAEPSLTLPKTGEDAATRSRNVSLDEADSGPPPQSDEVGVIVPGTPKIVATPTIAAGGDGDLAPFIAAGCSRSPPARTLDCVKRIPGACSIGIYPTTLLGLFAARKGVAIAECYEQGGGATNPDEIVELGGMLDGRLHYAIVSKGKLVVIRTRSAFAARFGPAATPEDALAFAIAMTRGQAVYNPIVPSEFHVYVPSIEGTRVVPIPGGYRVNLFSTQTFGCGLKPTSRLDLTVTTAGKVTQDRTAPLYADPASAGMCVD